jgi:hypothetical protein
MGWDYFIFKERWVENHKKKLLISSILISSILIANVACLMLIYPNLYQGKLNTDSLIPPKITSSLTTHSKSTQTISPILGPTPQRDLTAKCVHSVIYWSDHSEAWPINVIIGNITYTKEEEIAFYKTPIKDLNDYLFIQMTTAFLNFNNGSLSNGVEKTITDAAFWLENHPSGSKINESTRQTGNFLGVTLADYNNGKLGPALCANEPTSVPFKEIPSPTPTNTSTATITRLPTRTASDTPKPEPSRPQGPPASTATSTNIPPQPTKTLSLKPTDTPLPPPTETLPPESSPTPIPLPTPAPTTSSESTITP